MIQIISGKKGSGKTKRIINMANDSIKDAKSDVIFIDDDNRYMYDLRHQIRFINATEYSLANSEMFLGFLCGILAQNFDLGIIYIDAFLNLYKGDLESSQWFFDRLEYFSKERHVKFVLSVSKDEDELPDFLKSYVI